MKCEDERIHGGSNKDIGIDFSVSVNPLGMPEGCLDAVVRSFDAIGGYPETDNDDLIDALSVMCGGNGVILGNGSCELIYALCHYMSNKYPDYEALVMAPTFTEYEYAVKASGGRVRVIRTEVEQDFRVTKDIVSKLISNTDESTKLVFICNPNNPTGELLERDVIEDLAVSCHGKGAVLLVDECFMRFVKGYEEHTMMSVLDKYPDVIVLDAFTKFYAMAGLRVGYAVSSNDELLKGIRLQLQPWNVSVPAQEAAICALEDKGYGERTREFIREERTFLIDELDTAHVRVIGTPAADFILLSGPGGLREYLNRRGMDIRDCEDMLKHHDTASRDADGRAHYYRVSVRKRDENLRLINAIKEYIGGV